MMSTGEGSLEDRKGYPCLYLTVHSTLHLCRCSRSIWGTGYLLWAVAVLASGGNLGKYTVAPMEWPLAVSTDIPSDSMLSQCLATEDHTPGPVTCMVHSEDCSYGAVYELARCKLVQ